MQLEPIPTKGSLHAQIVIRGISLQIQAQAHVPSVMQESTRPVLNPVLVTLVQLGHFQQQEPVVVLSVPQGLLLTKQAVQNAQIARLESTRLPLERAHVQIALLVPSLQLEPVVVLNVRQEVSLH